MADRWQEINLRLDAELAQSLRDLKRGHDESLAEVVLRLLRKAVRQNPANRGMADARSSGKGARGGRSASGAARGGKPGKPNARGERGGSRGPARGKPFATREVADGDTWAPTEREPLRTGTAARPRPARPFPGNRGKAFRPQPAEGDGERRGRGFAKGPRQGDEGARPFRAKPPAGADRGRTKRPRKAKGLRSGRG